jgi:hypothetical protein
MLEVGHIGGEGASAPLDSVIAELARRQHGVVTARAAA